MYNKLNDFYRNLKAMLVVSLLCFTAIPMFAADWGGTLSDGATYTFRTSGNGFTVNNGNTVYDGFRDISLSAGRTATFRFETTSPILLNGRILVTGTLNLERTTSSNNPTLKLGTGNSDYAYLFYVYAEGTLNISGFGTDPTVERNMFIIDGGTVYNTPYDARSGVDVEGTKGKYLIRLKGTLTMDKVIVQNMYNPEGSPGVVYVNDGGALPFTMTDVVIRGCQATNGSFCYYNGTDMHITTMDNVEIWGCKSTSIPGGTIRTTGGVKAILTLQNSRIHDNESTCGGAIAWLAAGDENAILTIINSDLYNNKASTVGVDNPDRPGMGGALYLSAVVDIQSANIYNNEAERGGGICMLNYDGGAPAFNGKGFNLTIEDNVRVYNNTATEYGGGVFAHVRATADVGFDPDGNPVNTDNVFTMEGGEVCGNMAPKGAGIAIYDDAALRGIDKNGNISGPYSTTVKIEGGKICNNTCTATESGTQGGGFFISKARNTNLENGTQITYPPDLAPFTYEDVGGAGSLKIIATGGLLAANTSRNNSIDGTGGGIYINNEVVDKGGTCSVVIGGEVELYANTCDSDGGGVKIDNGDLIVKGGTVGCETFDYSYSAYQNGSWVTQSFTGVDGANIAYRGNGGGIAVAGGEVNVRAGYVNYNEAQRSGNTTNNIGHGGGFYVTGGLLSVHGGTISENTAEGNGGGFYVNVPAANIVTLVDSDSTATTISNNHAVNGGGAFVNRGVFQIHDATTFVTANGASNYGGGVYVGTGSLEVIASTLNDNTASGNGGGIYVNSGLMELTDVFVTSNTANANGGGFYVIGTSENTITGSIIDSNDGGTNGGGGFVSGTVTLNTGTSLIKNKAQNGGGIYVRNGTFTMNPGVTVGGSAVDANMSTGTGNNNGGGGIYVTGNTSKVDVKGGEISYNTAERNGGGLYVASSGTEGTNLSGNVLVSKNQAATSANGNGGGAFVSSGLLNLIGAGVIVSENEAKNGGGIYMNNGTVDVTSCSFLGNIANNGNGGGVYLGNGSLTLSGAIVSSNQATSTANNTGRGGGIYTGAGTILVKDNTQIGTYTSAKATAGSGNTAKQGGGIYVNGGDVTFNGGSFTENSASAEGGGIYIRENAIFNIKDEAYITDNYVPADGKGGGVYMDGTFNVGGGEAVLQIIKAYTNYAGESFSIETQNNVYLPSNEKHITLKSDISHQTDGEYDTNIGITVNHAEPCPHPVVYVEDVANEPWLANLMLAITENNGAVFDDTRTYVTIHTSKNYPRYQMDYMYFDHCWTTVVTSDPGTNAIEKVGDVYHIKTNEGLAWLSSLVNGLNHREGDATSNPFTTPQRGLNAVMDADVDMSDYLWVPMGSVKSYNTRSSTFTEGAENEDSYFTGEFNGQGYVITGIINGYLTGISRYGLFGATKGQLRNIFLDDYDYTAADVASNFGIYCMGGITGTADGGVISACEARGIMKQGDGDATQSYAGGIAGKTTGTAIIHSSMAMPEIQGAVDYIGGLVGQHGASSKLINSFANPIFPDNDYPMNTGKYIGGLVGDNLGLVENCYSRLQGSEPTHSGTNIFGWFAGTNESGANIKYCYAPRVANESGYDYSGFNYTKVNNGTMVGQDNYGTTLRYSGKYGFRHRDHQMKLLPNATDNPYEQAEGASVGANDTLVGGLMYSLNHWVKTTGNGWDGTSNTNGYAEWTRTMASPINDDYPIPMLTWKNGNETFNSVGSKDGIYMLYEDNVNDMWNASGKNFQALTSALGVAAMYLYDVQPGATAAPVSISGNTRVPLYIHEDVGITQTNNAALTARVGVTIWNSRKNQDNMGDDSQPIDQTSDPNWHLFSSAVQNVPLGIEYHTGEEAGYLSQIVNQTALTDLVWGDRTQFDPPKTTFYQSDDNNMPSYDSDGSNIGYFPTNTPYGTWRGTPYTEASNEPKGFFDFYDYSEIYYHWINYKREGSNAYQDHWHMDKDAEDKKHYKISGYRNVETLPAGKGYLMALSSESMMMADGVLNTGDKTTGVTITGIGENLPPHGHGSNNYTVEWRSLNLIGNPYQSYLDFKEFVDDEDNSHLLYSENGSYSYATRDDATWEYTYYTTSQSDNPVSGTRYLHPHQGFFVKVNGSGQLNFNDNMRVTGNNLSAFRGENDDLNYPLVNLLCFEASGKRNFTTIEINRPQLGGGLKMKNLRTGTSLIYAYLDGQEYQTLFTPEGINIVPVHFETEEDGMFTLRWNTFNGDFSYLHLIDNLTGTDIDCLAAREYKFESKTTDYKSRFKLVFNCTGMEENEDESLTGAAVFAFQEGDALVINGEGSLQMFDLNGRCLMAGQTVNQQSYVSLPNVAPGLYLLRLTTDKQARVQKIIIK